MNQNDINAARRLIAQFEERALGRHNSNQFNRGRDYATPHQRQHVTPKMDPQDCAVGDYCWEIEGAERYPNQPIVRVLKKPDLKFFAYDGCNYDMRVAEYTSMEFERVRLIQNGNFAQAWRRIA